jgi:NAD(P)-dependent dehydrogenase (short-subunit alcohol dehydrogenase family)
METPMEHSIALLTGTTSGLGYAAARTLAREGWRMITAEGVEAS